MLFECLVGKWLPTHEGKRGRGKRRRPGKKWVQTARRQGSQAVRQHPLTTHHPAPSTQHPHTHYPPSSPHCVWLSATGLNKTLKAQNNDADACQVKLKTETPKALDCRTSRTNRK